MLRSVFKLTQLASHEPRCTARQTPHIGSIECAVACPTDNHNRKEKRGEYDVKIDTKTNQKSAEEPAQ